MSRDSERPERRAVVTGYLFKLIRESIPRSQEAIARDLMVDRGTIQGWETGRRPFTAVPFAQAVALRHRLAVLGAAPPLVDGLDVAAEADYLICQIVEKPPEQVDLDSHPLGWTVMTHTLAEMLAWPVTGRTPELIRSRNPGTTMRRGPVAPAPVLDSVARRAFFTNLRVLADRVRGSEGTAVLLQRQASFLLGLDPTASAYEWLNRSRRADYFSRPRGWSWSWPAARSIATSLARQGNVEPLREFIAHAHQDDICERAGLNYWAYWVGEIPGRQRGDQFMVESNHRWPGNRLLTHIVQRLESANGFRDLYVHTLRSLLVVRPGLLLEEPTMARSLYSRGEQLLDEDSVSMQSRQELGAILNGMRVEGLIP